MMPVTEQILSDEERTLFNQNGFLIKRGFFTPEETAEIRETFMAQNVEGPIPGLSEISANYSKEDPLAFYPRMMHPHRFQNLAVGPLALRTMLDPRIGAVLKELFGEEPIAAQSMFYFKPPKARGQELHQDNFYLRVKPGNCMAAWLAVDDADEENGGLMVAPGTHQLDVVCPERADLSRSFTLDYVRLPEGVSAAPARMKAGDMLFFNGNLIHGSYPNISLDRFRRAFICHYVPESSAEMSGGYRPLLRFSGEEVTMAAAEGGGPCGVIPNESASF